MTEVSDLQGVKCYHCGLDCDDEPILAQEKSFCCVGCKTVFEILDEGDLCAYYDVANTPGISLKDKRASHGFAYLLDEKIKRQLLSFSNGEVAKVTFFLPQIHCAACIQLLEQLYKLHPAITQCRVNFVRRELTVTYQQEEMNLAELAELLDSIGYTPDISLSDAENKKPKTDRAYFYRLGVAGFSFGNIMLFSFPEYLGMDKYLDGSFSQYFGYLNLFLALPVVFYSGQEFFRSAYHGIKAKQLNLDIPISLGILVLFIRSTAEIVLQIGAGYMDSLAGLVFFLLIGKWFQRRTYEQLSFDRDYKSYFPIAITRYNGEEEETVPIANIEVGDKLLIRNGEVIPADGILLEGEANIDYSFVTGEAEPEFIPLAGQVYAGGRQIGGAIRLQLTKNVSQSYLTQLWGDEAFASPEKVGLSTLADNAARYFTPAILAIAFLSGGYWLQYDTAMSMRVFTAVLIVACPCALALSVPFTLGNAQRILGHMGLYIKNLAVIERLYNTSAIVFDKTGTLTLNKKQELRYEGIPINAAGLNSIKSLVKQSNHPISKLLGASLPGSGKLNVAFFKESVGQGIEGLVGETYIRVGKRSFVSEDHFGETEKGSVWVSIDGEIMGCFEIAVSYREGLKDIISDLQKNYSLSLLSGDNDSEKGNLRSIFGQEVPLQFKSSPKDKLNYLRTLQSNGAKAIMLGDGLNDAGALKESSVGIAVSDDVNNFSPACDAILGGDNFGDLPKLLRYAKSSVRLVYGAFGISLLYNLVGLAFAVQGLLSPLVAAILMPLSSITVVLFGTVSTYLLAKYTVRK